MKKLIALLLAASMVLCVSASAYDEVWDDTEYDDTEYDELPFEEEFEYEFDKSSGTFIKMISDNEYMYVPDEIEGVEVKKILPGAFSDKLNMTWADIVTPQAMEGAVFVNCPNLETLYFVGSDILEKPYENCNKLKDIFIGEESDIVEVTFNGMIINPRDLMEELGVFKGNGTKKESASDIFDPSKITLGTFRIDLSKNNVKDLSKYDNDTAMEWDKTLTRAEAVVTVLRLMGKEEDAKKETGYSAFSDVPDWAVSYVNYAYKNGIVKGVSEDKFEPFAPCGAKDYCVMLLRLTDLKENVDYSWMTALKDMRSAIGEGIRGVIGLRKKYDEESLFAWICLKGLTRKYAASLIYGFLSAPFADGRTSYGDVLCEERDLSPREMIECKVRLSERSINRKMFPSYTYKPGEEQDLNSYLFYGDEKAKFDILNSQTVIISPEIASKAEELTKGLTDDYEKAKAISKWLYENIEYDHEKAEKIRKNNNIAPLYVAGLSTIEDVAKATEKEDTLPAFNERKGVCGDYALLTREMFTAVGLKAIFLGGLSMYTIEPHGWNEAYIDGRWFPIDNTWGMEYFDMDPEKFYQVHQPDYHEINISLTTK